MHRISDFRFGGIARRNFNLFRKLCGDENLQNVLVVTNMWGEVDVTRGEAREKQLRTDPALFQPVMVQGAQMQRHYNTSSSAQAIIGHFIDTHPVALRIQTELVDEAKDILETSAGQEVDRDLAALLAKHKAEMDDLRREMDEALAAKDTQTRRELADARQELSGKIEQLQHDRARLSREYQEEKQRAEERLRAVEKDLEKERQAREDRQKDIEALKQDLADVQRKSDAEREATKSKLQQLGGQHGLLYHIAPVLKVVAEVALRVAIEHERIEMGRGRWPIPSSLNPLSLIQPEIVSPELSVPAVRSIHVSLLSFTHQMPHR